MHELLLFLTMGLNMTSDIIDRRVSNTSSIQALSLWTAIIQLLLICPFLGLVDWPGWQAVMVLLLVGWFSSHARGRWYKAISNPEERLSRFTPFVRLSSVMVMVLAVALLGETVTPVMALGATLMIGAGLTVTMERAGASWGSFFHANRALGMVAIFAFSNAMVSVAYKYLLLKQVTIITIYFLLKFFQCLPLAAPALARGTLLASYAEITNIRLFVASRVLQTVAALVFLLALNKLQLSRVEPLIALAPFLFLGWEWLERRYALFGYRPPANPPPTGARMRGLRLVATGLTILGLILLHQR